MKFYSVSIAAGSDGTALSAIKSVSCDEILVIPTKSSFIYGLGKIKYWGYLNPPMNYNAKTYQPI